MNEQVEEVKQIVKKVDVPKKAFMNKKTTNEEKIEQEEKELKKLIAENKGESTEEVKESEPEVTGEEKTFKKRYGDLRRHSQKQKQELDEKISALESQLSDATKAQIELPKSEEEIEVWSKDYPDVAAIIETIAIKKAKEQSEGLQTKMEEINKLQHSAKKEKAEAELYTIHPDFENIRTTDDFHQWADEQPKWVQEALYENETDARSAARAIDLYKIDRDIDSPKKKSRKNNAAEEVSTKSKKGSPPVKSNSSKWSESIVEKMSADEYEENSDSIMEAIRSGNFNYDVSGEAR